MTVGDGSNWDESNPTNSTLAISIDDYDRDLRVGVRSRMTIEHEWPSSQSATNQAGQHKFITLQNQAAKPTVSGTQLAAIYTKTSGAGLQELYWENEAGTELQLTNRTALNYAAYLGATYIPKVIFNMTASGTASFLFSIGASSVTYVATNNYRVVFSTNFVNTAYAPQITLFNDNTDANQQRIPEVTKMSISTMEMVVFRPDLALTNVESPNQRLFVTIWGSQ